MRAGSVFDRYATSVVFSLRDILSMAMVADVVIYSDFVHHRVGCDIKHAKVERIVSVDGVRLRVTGPRTPQCVQREEVDP